jgi:hypothetical protein
MISHPPLRSHRYLRLYPLIRREETPAATSRTKSAPGSLNTNLSGNVARSMHIAIMRVPAPRRLPNESEGRPSTSPWVWAVLSIPLDGLRGNVQNCPCDCDYKAHGLYGYDAYGGEPILGDCLECKSAEHTAW